MRARVSWPLLMQAMTRPGKVDVTENKHDRHSEGTSLAMLSRPSTRMPRFETVVETDDT